MSTWEPPRRCHQHGGTTATQRTHSKLPRTGGTHQSGAGCLRVTPIDDYRIRYPAQSRWAAHASLDTSVARKCPALRRVPCAFCGCRAGGVVAEQQRVKRHIGADGLDLIQLDRHLGRAAPRTANGLCDSFKLSMMLVHDRLHEQLVSCAPGVPTPSPDVGRRNHPESPMG